MAGLPFLLIQFSATKSTTAVSPAVNNNIQALLGITLSLQHNYTYMYHLYGMTENIG